MFILKYLVIILIELCILSNEADAEERILDERSGRKKFEKCDCGMPVSISKRAVGASEIESFHKYPWMVGIYINGSLACGGTLIDTQYVLTAAHCLTDLNEYDTAKEHERQHMKPVDISIKLSIHRTTDPTTVEVAISKYFIHPSHHIKNNRFRNDIAIIRLERSVVYSNKVKPICLSVHNERTQPGGTAKITGWGKTDTDDGQASEILREVDLPIKNRAYCDKKLETEILNNTICVGGEEGKDSCQGDSGGPLFYSDDDDKNRVYQIGVISWGVSCGKKGIPAVYTNIIPFMEWIRDITKDSPSCEDMNPYLIQPNLEDCGLPQEKCTNNKTTCNSGEYLYSWMAKVYNKNELLGSAVLIDNTHLITTSDVISPRIYARQYRDLHVALGMRRLVSDPHDSSEVQSRIKVLYHVSTDKLSLIIIEMDIMGGDQTMLHRPICMVERKEDIGLGGKMSIMYWKEENKQLEKAKVPDNFNKTESQNSAEDDTKNKNKPNGENDKKDGRHDVNDRREHQVEKRELVKASSRKRNAAFQEDKMKELLRVKRHEGEVINSQELIKNGALKNNKITERRRATVQHVTVDLVNSRQCRPPNILKSEFLCAAVRERGTCHEKGAVLMKFYRGRFYMLGIATPDERKCSTTKSFIDISGNLGWIFDTVTENACVEQGNESEQKPKYNNDDYDDYETPDFSDISYGDRFLMY